MDFFQPFAACCFDDVLKLTGRCFFIHNKRDIPGNRRILWNWCIRDLRDLHELLRLDVPEITYTPIPKYPSVTRDIALVVNKETAAGQLVYT